MAVARNTLTTEEARGASSGRPAIGAHADEGTAKKIEVAMILMINYYY
jgi:hypothetical protein